MTGCRPSVLQGTFTHTWDKRLGTSTIVMPASQTGCMAGPTPRNPWCCDKERGARLCALESESQTKPVFLVTGFVVAQGPRAFSLAKPNDNMLDRIIIMVGRNLFLKTHFPKTITFLACNPSLQFPCWMRFRTAAAVLMVGMVECRQTRMVLQQLSAPWEEWQLRYDSECSTSLCTSKLQYTI